MRQKIEINDTFMNCSNMGPVTTRIYGRMPFRASTRGGELLADSGRGKSLGVKENLDTIAFLSRRACYCNKQFMRVGTCDEG